MSGYDGSSEAEGTLREWIDTPDWKASAAFLDEHREELLAEASQAVLGEWLRQPNPDPTVGLHWAVLVLAAAGQDRQGYGYLAEEDPERRGATLVALLPAADLETLSAFVVLAQARTGDPDELAEAAVLNAVALALGGETEGAVDQARHVRPHLPPGSAPAWADRLTATAARHPDHAAALAAVRQALTTSDA